MFCLSLLERDSISSWLKVNLDMPTATHPLDHDILAFDGIRVLEGIEPSPGVAVRIVVVDFSLLSRSLHT